MVESKRILIVDDDFETVELLRAALAFIDRNIVTLGVPSGEEAWVELVTNPADLLLVDLNLPGMNGPDLVRRIQKRYPDLPVILMSGYDMEHMMTESEGLTITRFFEKAGDIGNLIDIVKNVLYGELDSLGPYVDVISIDLQNRLTELHKETEAKRLYLGTPDGAPLYAEGDNLSDVNESELLKALSEGLSQTTALDQTLGGNPSQLIQVISNETYEFYLADLGGLGFVTLLFDAQPQRARITTVWVFLQRAIPDLILGLTGKPATAELPALTPAQEEALSPPAEPEPTIQPTFELPDNLEAGQKLSFEEAMAQGLVGNIFGNSAAEESLDDAIDAMDIDLFGDFDDAVGDTGEWADLLEEAEPDPEAVAAIEELNLDDMSDTGGGADFWDTAADKARDQSGGLSLEEAIKQGLISGDHFNL